MKMVAAAKYAKAERELRPARPFGQGAQGKPAYVPLPISMYDVSFFNSLKKN